VTCPTSRRTLAQYLVANPSVVLALAATRALDPVSADFGIWRYMGTARTTDQGVLWIKPNGDDTRLVLPGRSSRAVFDADGFRTTGGARKFFYITKEEAAQGVPPARFPVTIPTPTTIASLRQRLRLRPFLAVHGAYYGQPPFMRAQGPAGPLPPLIYRPELSNRPGSSLDLVPIEDWQPFGASMLHRKVELSIFNRVIFGSTGFVVRSQTEAVWPCTYYTYLDHTMGVDLATPETVQSLPEDLCRQLVSLPGVRQS